MVQIAITSGKGGTGKTTVALGLALTGGPLTLIDADVEEPNCQVLLAGEPMGKEPAKVMVPTFAEDACARCGHCARACRFNALVVGNRGHLLFPELCHGCGACQLVCKHGAIREGEREIGVISRFARGDIRLLEGRLNVGETSGVPLIRQLKRKAVKEDLAIVDSPPGTSCNMVAAVAGANYCLLLTEPTLFGRHDLEAALTVVEALGIPKGVVINRSGDGDGLIEEICRQRGVPVLARIPHDGKLAEAYAEKPSVRAGCRYPGGAEPDPVRCGSGDQRQHRPQGLQSLVGQRDPGLYRFWDDRGRSGGGI
ncbi:MAG: 4Fe-4S binding protein [Firmicutes bacterium]|nr:4Fe-4S binding protein [Bacillota bacterium]